MSTRRHLHKSAVRTISENERISLRVDKDVALRKQRRYQLISNKRAKLSEYQIADFEDARVEITNVLKGFKHAKGTDRISALEKLIKILEEPIDDIKPELIEKIMDVIMYSMDQPDSLEQFKALWATINLSAAISSDLVSHCFYAVPYALRFLSTDIIGLQALSAWLIGNLAAENTEYRDRLRNMGVISPLIQCLDSSDKNVLRSASFALLNVMRGPNPRIPHFLDSGIIDPLLKQTRADHDAITQSELWSLLAYITCHHVNSRLMLLKHDVVLLAVKQLEEIVSRSALESLSPAVCIPHVRFIGTYASSNNDKDCIATADSRVIRSIMGCLNLNSKALRKEALWVLANITVEAEAVSLFDLQMLNNLLDLFLDSEQSFDKRRLLADIFLHMCIQQNEHLPSLIQSGKLIQGFHNLLISNDQVAAQIALDFFLEIGKMQESSEIDLSSTQMILEQFMLSCSNETLKHSVQKVLNVLAGHGDDDAEVDADIDLESNHDGDGEQMELM